MSERPDGGHAAMVCARHPKRTTGLRCVRCDRPACPACLHEAAVGYQCVDCLRQGRRTQRAPTTVVGAQLRAGGNLIIPILVALNVVVYAITAAQVGSLSGVRASDLFDQWALVPQDVAAGEYWRLLTSGFLHFGVFHILVNMVALYIIGRDLETVLGRARFLAVYLISLFGGSVLVYLLSEPLSRTAGASGAIFGVMGGLLIVLLRMRRSPGPALTIIAINVVITLTIPGISVWGHLGGLAFGVAATAALAYAPRAQRNLVQGTALTALVALIVILAVLADMQLPG